MALLIVTNGAATVTATVRVGLTIAPATSNGVATVTASVKRTRRIAPAAVAGTATVTATVRTAKRITASSSGVATVGATVIKTAGALKILIQGHATVTGAVTKGNLKVLTVATVSGHATVAALVGRVRPIGTPGYGSAYGGTPYGDTATGGIATVTATVRLAKRIAATTTGSALVTCIVSKQKTIVPAYIYGHATVYNGTKILWGAWADGADTYGTGYFGAFDTNSTNLFEQHAGKAESICHFGWGWDPTQHDFNWRLSWMNAVRARGSIPLADLFPNIAPNNIALRDLTANTFGTDAAWTTWFTQAAAWGHPFFLRLAHEMNGNWFSHGTQSGGANTNANTTAEFVAFWRHMHDLAVAAGATNITWVWSPNVDNAGQPSLSSLYPGDAYVDWTALDGYNKSLAASVWKTFSQVFSTSYSQILAFAPAKPMMIAEVGSDAALGDKAAWITDMLGTQLPDNFPKVKAVVWFNWHVSSTSAWDIESGAGAQQAFANGIASAYYTTNAYATASTSPIAPPTQFGAIVTRSRQLAPSVAGAATVTAAVTRTRARTASIAASATVTAAVSRTRPVAASATGTATVAVTRLVRIRARTASINGTASVGLVLGVTRVLTASSTGRASVEAFVDTTSPGTIILILPPAQANAAATVTVSALVRNRALTPSITGTATVSATVRTATRITASAAGAATVSCSLRRTRRVQPAQAIGTATVACSILLDKFLTVAISHGSANVTATVGRVRVFTAISHGAATVSSGLVLVPGLQIGASTGTATVACSVSVTRVIAAQTNGVTTVSCHLFTHMTFFPRGNTGVLGHSDAGSLDVPTGWHIRERVLV